MKGIMMCSETVQVLASPLDSGWLLSKGLEIQPISMGDGPTDTPVKDLHQYVSYRITGSSGAPSSGIYLEQLRN